MHSPEEVRSALMALGWERVTIVDSEALKQIIGMSPGREVLSAASRESLQQAYEALIEKALKRMEVEDV